MGKNKTAAADSTDTQEPAKLHRVEAMVYGPEGMIERAVSAPLTEEEARKYYGTFKEAIKTT